MEKMYCNTTDLNMTSWDLFDVLGHRFIQNYFIEIAEYAFEKIVCDLCMLQLDGFEEKKSYWRA